MAQHPYCALGLSLRNIVLRSAGDGLKYSLLSGLSGTNTVKRHRQNSEKFAVYIKSALNYYIVDVCTLVTVCRLQPFAVSAGLKSAHLI